MGMNSGIKSALNWTIGLVTIALVIIVSLIIFGNLSGNLGFAESTQGYNDTQAVINNFTTGTGQLVKQVPTVFLFVGISLLLFVLVGVLAWVIKKMLGFAGKKTTD